MKLLLIFLTLIGSPHSVAIKTSRHTIMKDAELEVMCIVDRKPVNRWIDIGVAFEEGVVASSSSQNLEGEKAPRLFTTRFDHIPCGVVEAYCIVSDSLGPIDKAMAKIEVVGCETVTQGRRKGHAKQ